MSVRITLVAVAALACGPTPVAAEAAEGSVAATNTDGEHDMMTETPDTLPWPSGDSIAAAVQLRVAQAWGVAPERVRLDWGPAPAEPALPGTARVTLAGSGAAGRWVVDLAGPGDPAAAVRVGLKAGLEVLRPVAARPLERGQVLGEDDIAWAPVLEWGPPRPPPSEAPVVTAGWVVRRRIRAGEALEPPAVERPDLVENGDDVELLWEDGAVLLRVRARALGSGPEGALVWVRTESGKRLRGRVDGPGTVRVGPSAREAA